MRYYLFTLIEFFFKPQKGSGYSLAVKEMFRSLISHLRATSGYTVNMRKENNVCSDVQKKEKWTDEDYQSQQGSFYIGKGS